MECKEFKDFEKKTFLILTVYYLELENSYNNMCDMELGTLKKELKEMEDRINHCNCLLNSMAKSIYLEEEYK